MSTVAIPIVKEALFAYFRPEKSILSASMDAITFIDCFLPIPIAKRALFACFRPEKSTL